MKFSVLFLTCIFTVACTIEYTPPLPEPEPEPSHTRVVQRDFFEDLCYIMCNHMAVCEMLTGTIETCIEDIMHELCPNAEGAYSCSFVYGEEWTATIEQCLFDSSMVEECPGESPESCTGPLSTGR